MNPNAMSTNGVYSMAHYHVILARNPTISMAMLFVSYLIPLTVFVSTCGLLLRNFPFTQFSRSACVRVCAHVRSSYTYSSAESEILKLSS